MIVTIKTGIGMRVPGIYINDRLIRDGIVIPPGTMAKFRVENRPSLVPVNTSVTFTLEGKEIAVDVSPGDLEEMIRTRMAISTDQDSGD